jgi:NAD-dependent deacetylase
LDKIKIFADKINKSKNIVAFTGAGASTESNIPDFRSDNGLYNKIKKSFKCSPEYMLSKSFFDINKETFFKFYRENMIFDNIEPNNVHKSLFKLEKLNKLKNIITQNIDGLHQKAGSKNIIELHGSILENYCTKCNKKYGLNFIKKNTPLPLCENCNAVVRPDIVLYEEALSESNILKSIESIKKADMLIVIGSSLLVYPAAGLIKYFSGDNFIIINKESLEADKYADLVFNEKAGYVLKETIALL